MATLSRRRLASYVASELASGRDIVPSLAAYLVETKRVRELSLIVADIEQQLQSSGVIVADVASARDLTADTRAAITRFIETQYHSTDVRLRETVDPSLIGGVRLRIGDDEIDGTIKRKITKLKAEAV